MWIPTSHRSRLATQVGLTAEFNTLRWLFSVNRASGSSRAAATNRRSPTRSSATLTEVEPMIYKPVQLGSVRERAPGGIVGAA